ncbi:hypothetical protein [Luteitalea sp.]|uniref:TRM11 family SAM-dependent methyltransferase n=1 Tax=Luteitalea sp. TaxID=2004800 RepID=UPI0025C22C91|nr:hypothetical protein [Luteitalea sp.]
MNLIQLPRSVQFLYEEHLARLEFEALGCHDIDRVGDRWDQMTATVNGTRSALIDRSAYLGTLDGTPSVYEQLTKPKYQGGRFNRTRSVNQYLTHWIYPYQGKFHPQMVRGLFNILGVKRGHVVAEPFLGSGTAAVEASLLGARVVGVDLSPLCVMLARVKTTAWSAVDDIRPRVHKLLAKAALTLDDATATKRDGQAVSDFLTIARMVTASDVARRGRDEVASLRKNLEAMLESVEAYAAAVREFNLRPGAVDVAVGDCRDLQAAGIRKNSVDAIVTSPPYSIALDYVKNDEHALAQLDVEIPHLRNVMTGVRGRGAAQKLQLYNDDMQVMFQQVARVLKPGGRAAFVIGDATVDGEEYTTTEVMASWAVTAGLRLERTIPKIVFGLYSVMKDEDILVFRKE